MEQLFLVFIIIVFAVAIPLILLGLWFYSEKSHQFINGRAKITNINQYAKNVGNSFILTGLLIICVTLLFYLQNISVTSFAVIISVTSLLPLPFVIYTHKKYT